MPDYNLGRAHGDIQIDYDGDGADRAARDLDKVVASSEATDKSLSKTQKTLEDTGRQFGQSGDSAAGYGRRLKDVEDASRDLEQAERDHRDALLDTRATLDDIEAAEDRVTEARKRHSAATSAARDAQKALTAEMSGFRRALDGLANLIPGLSGSVDKLGSAQEETAKKSKELSGALGLVSAAALALGQPEIAAAAKTIDSIGSAISGVGSKIAGVAGGVAGFEVAFGKIAGLTLAVPSLAGLAGLGGAASVEGVLELADAVKQLSGGLGLLPAVISAVEFSTQTLSIAFHGVGDALSDMMSDDPKKFLEDIKDMGPVAAQAMLQVAQFRDQFRLAGGAIQDSFFTEIAGDIAPLIQTWLPALTSGMTQVAGAFGTAAHQFAGLLEQPAVMQAFQYFVTNVAQGIQALQPAMAPLLQIFTQLTATGSSFFQQIGGQLSHILDFFAQVVQTAASSGQLQAWINDGINAFGHLVNIAYSFGSAFLNIMDIADKFGGGGLLGWLEKLAQQFNNWTQSAAGQKALTNFFTELQKATDAFLPMLGPLVDGLVAIGGAIVQMGVGTAPGWQIFFDSFAKSMTELAPQIVAIGPSLANFIAGLGQGFEQLMGAVGPQLPAIFKELSDAMLALIPQVEPLVTSFLNLVQAVGPQLPGLFQAVTDVIVALLPIVPNLTHGVELFVAALSGIIRIAADVVGWLNGIGRGADDLVHKIPGLFHNIMDGITDFFAGLPEKAMHWGESLINGLVDGIQNGLGSVGGAAKDVVEAIAKWFQSSPAKVGPFSGSGYTLIRGQKMVTDMAAGMAAAQPAIEAAAASTAAAASGALAGVGSSAGGTVGGAPSPGGSSTVGGALLPDNIAGADTSILTAYLRHQFSDTNGLKGLAKDLGDILKVAQAGTNLITQNLLQPLFQGLGMLPGSDDKTWRKLTPKEFAAQQQSDAEKKALKDEKKGPTWTDVFVPSAAAPTSPAAAATTPVPTAVGNTNLISALQAKGFSAQQIRLIQGFSQVEGNNPAGNPTLGFTDGQLGGASDLQSHVDALAKQFQDRASVAGQFPEGGTDQQQAQWIAKVVGQSGVQSDWQGNPQPKDYVQRVVSALPGAAPPPGQKDPTWGQVTGGSGSGSADYSNWYPAAGAQAPVATAAQIKTGADGSISVPPGTALPANADAGFSVNPASKASTVTLGGSTASAVARAGLAPLYAPGTSSSDPSKFLPPGIQALLQKFNLTANTTPHGALHSAGFAMDIHGTPEMMDAFAQYVQDNLAGQTLELIHQQGAAQGQGQHWGIAGGQIVDQPGAKYQNYFTDATNPGEGYSAHTDTGPGPHVHWATDVDIARGGVVPAPPPGAGASINSGLVLPSGKTLGELTDASQKNLSVNDKLLQSYLQGNPALATQIDAAKTPGAPDATVTGALTGISKTIDDLKAQDAVGNKNTIDALQSAQSGIAQQQGYTSGPSTLSQAQSLASGISGAISGVYKSIGSGLDALAATQDFADRLVYGVRNTEDINKLIDDYQKWITYAADVVSTAGSIVSTVGSFTGGADFGGTSAAGSALSLIASVLQGVNSAIDFGQQIYEVTMGYVGKFVTVLGGLGGSDLMGNVGFLLNKNTGELLSYSQDNPGQQNSHKVPSWMNSWYDYNGNGNPNPQVNQQLNVYAGPGQSPSAMMNETMWMVNTQGTTGAMQPANF